MFKKNIATVKFIVKFVLVYVLLISLYDWYISTFDDKQNFIADTITYFVAASSSNLAEIFGFQSSIFQNEYEPSVNLILDNVFVARIIEGCNGVALIILFVSFVLSFKGKFIYTLLFIPMGVLLIHLVNVLRLFALAFVFRYYNSWSEEFHDYIFPAIIYSMVFLLWVIWVNYFVLGEEK